MTEKFELGPRQRELVDALRSGKYKQGRRCLKNRNSFCCLGVACEISKLGKWDRNDRYFESSGALPTKVIEHFAFKDLYGSANRSSLVYENDRGQTFDQIADFIEANSGELFHESK